MKRSKTFYVYNGQIRLSQLLRDRCIRNVCIFQCTNYLWIRHNVQNVNVCVCTRKHLLDASVVIQFGEKKIIIIRFEIVAATTETHLRRNIRGIFFFSRNILIMQFIVSVESICLFHFQQWYRRSHNIFSSIASFF